MAVGPKQHIEQALVLSEVVAVESGWGDAERVQHTLLQRCEHFGEAGAAPHKPDECAGDVVTGRQVRGTGATTSMPLQREEVQRVQKSGVCVV